MNHASHATSTSAGAMATATSAAMDHDMGGSAGCEISMLWNWNTINACFFSESWKITSRGMFAGSCVGIVLLGIALEFLRRSIKEYDRFIIRQHVARSLDAAAAAGGGSEAQACGTGKVGGGGVPPFRPSVWQQAVRATLHMVQFAVAYILMLLAMYYNGYIIICIFIGIYIGGFIFQWETLSEGSSGNTSAANEATVCCG
ncbi:related to copper transport protein [Cephalotrichum gorgonifer]|uniref:Copper transport protein n=1 Tax=Cephalotrichum gorgonifer TaxID=2041049 RepID=A0AAE8N062_9PEZI|nr:related to copper transport protein [Cephalotrichum gorgonifer]